MIITARTKKLAEFAFHRFGEEASHCKIFGRRIVLWKQEKCSRCGAAMILPNWPVQIDAPRTVVWDTRGLEVGDQPSREVALSGLCSECGADE